MLKKISLSVMTFTYLFAGVAHFTRFHYFLSIAPSFLPYPVALVGLTGITEIFLGALLPLPRARRWACYGLLFLWSMALPVNSYVLLIGGAGIPLPHWQLVGLIPFHLFLMFWAFWHCLPEKKHGEQRVPFGAASEN